MNVEFTKVLLMFSFGLGGVEVLNAIQTFIVNGTDARIEEFPFLVE